MSKGFRDGQKEKMRKDVFDSLSDEDVEHIKAGKDFENVKAGTKAYSIALFCDTLRLQLYRDKNVVEKSLINIRNARNSIRRLKTQLLSNAITEQVKEGVFMNEDEMNSLIGHNEWLLKAEVYGLPQILSSIRGVVGHMDHARTIVLTEEEYEAYVFKIEGYLLDLGYEMPYKYIERGERPEI